MTYWFFGQCGALARAKHIEGKLEGKLDALRQILTVRGLELSTEQRNRGSI